MGNELTESMWHVPTTTLRFDLREDVVAEIEETYRMRLRERALHLASEDTWVTRRIELIERLRGNPVRQLLSVEGLVRQFAEKLCPILFETSEEYVEMLTRAIVGRLNKRRQIKWIAIAEQALQSCCREGDWQRSSEWLAKMLKTAGFGPTDYSPRTKTIFETMLLGWMVKFDSWDDRELATDCYGVARIKIRHIALLAPETPTQRVGRELGPEMPLPSLSGLKQKGAIPQRLAAQLLRCSPRTIRHYLKLAQLTKTERGWVECDEKLEEELRQRFGAAVRRTG